MQYLDLAGVQALWEKMKGLAKASKTIVSIDSTPNDSFAGFTITSIVHSGSGEDGNTEYKFSLRDVQSASGLSSLLTTKADASDLSEISTKVTTLVGQDTGKSIRTIANEELATQLIPANAQAALDTLQEIAAWIQSHPGDVATINSKIQALESVTALPASGENPASGTIAAYAKGLVDAENTRAVAEEARIDNILTKQKNVNGATEDGVLIRLGAIESALGQNDGEMSISEQVAYINEVIEDLNWDAETSDNGNNDATHVLTGIHVENGTLSSVDEMEIAPLTTAQLNLVLI